jgi:hypothetical protein
MRLAVLLASSILVAAVGCGESAPSSDSASRPAASAGPPAPRKGPSSVGKQTFEKRREYSAADPEGPPSKY